MTLLTPHVTLLAAHSVCPSITDWTGGMSARCTVGHYCSKC